MRAIPSQDIWLREEFCAARHRQMEQQKKLDSQQGVEAIYMEPGYDEVICDYCNADIEGQLIRLVEFGRKAVCGHCYNKYYANEPNKFRKLREDGSLGEYLEVGDGQD